jgi:cytoskeletal protein CcmA (bactofilin family)
MIDERHFSVLGVETDLKGTIKFDQSLIMRGRYQGHIISTGDLTIEHTADVQAEVQANALVLEGSLKGNARIATSLDLGAKASLVGDVQVKSLSLQQGAIFLGHVHMLSDANLLDIFSATPEQIKKIIRDQDQSQQSLSQ